MHNLQNLALFLRLVLVAGTSSHHVKQLQLSKLVSSASAISDSWSNKFLQGMQNLEALSPLECHTALWAPPSCSIPPSTAHSLTEVWSSKSSNTPVTARLIPSDKNNLKMLPTTWDKPAESPETCTLYSVVAVNHASSLERALTPNSRNDQ